MRQNITTSLFALLAFLLLSFSDAGVKLSSASLSTIQITALIATMSLIPMTLHLWHQGRLLSPLPRNPWLMILRSTMRVIQTPCMFYAFATLPLTQVYAGFFTMPLLTSALCALLLSEALRRDEIIAVLLGFVGALISLDPAGSPLELGHLALLLMVIFGALDSVIVRRTSTDEALSVTAFWPVLNVALVMGVFSLAQLQPVSTQNFYILAGTAIVGWLGGLCFIHALRRGPVITASSMQYSQILWAGLIGLLIFDETITIHAAVGSIIIVACGLHLMKSNKKGGESSSSCTANQASPCH